METKIKFLKLGNIVVLSQNHNHVIVTVEISSRGFMDQFDEKNKQKIIFLT